MITTKELMKISQNAHKEMFDDIKNNSQTRWEQKQILEKLLIYQGDSLENIILNGRGTISISDKMVFNGHSTLCLTTDTNIENINPRPSSSLKVLVNDLNLSSYNRISLWVYPEAEGFQSFYFHFSAANDQSEEIHAPALEPNKWNHVLWELDKTPRDHVNKISIVPFLMGCPPEAKPSLKVYIGEIQVEKVEGDYEEGWQLDHRIAYCHSGYFNQGTKIALTQVANDQIFKLKNSKNEEIFVNSIKHVNTDEGQYYLLDFTDFTKTGEYYIQIDQRKSELFRIDQNPYLNSIWKSLNFLRMLRCGEDVVGCHSACHLNCRTVHPDGRSVPNHGGWHDAGDVSQFEICTAEMAHALLDLAQVYQQLDSDLYERLLEEAKVGLMWLLRTRFGDGMRSLAVSYSIWRSNILETDNKSVSVSVAENGPFENFLASAAEAVAYRLYKTEDEVFANWCLRSSIEDFQFAKEGYQNGIYTKRWGPNIDSQVAGHAIIAACELYLATNDEKYIEFADHYAQIVLSTQQVEMPNWDFPMRGYFYEDPNHDYLLTYEHRGHEQSPIQGLARLCEIKKDHPNYHKWYQGLELYRDYIKASMKMATIYNLLPGQVYLEDKLNIERFTIPSSFGTKETALIDLKRQIRNGRKLNNGVYLRQFPIAIQRRGYHATLLSKVKAVTMAAKILNDQSLFQIAVFQLEWILGKNPFASSTMFGEGHNYHPLYVAFSRQIVGALPVGIKTYKDNDRPYWPVTNEAVYKEIWGHTTGKFLWVLADIIRWQQNDK